MNITKEKARRLRELIVKASAGLTDEEALEGVELFPAWKPGERYLLGQRLQHGGKLWRVLQPDLTASELYPPGAAGTEALYEEIAKPGSGETPEDPIAYNNNMALEEGKYYAQAGVVYICTRDTINPVYADLADLVGLYVEVYEPAG